MAERLPMGFQRERRRTPRRRGDVRGQRGRRGRRRSAGLSVTRSAAPYDEGAVHYTRRRAPLRLVEAMPFRPWAGTPERRVLRAYRSWRTGGEVKGEAKRGG
jgi:hypothetical protein